MIVEDRGVAGNLLRMPFLMTGGFHRQPGVTVRRVKEVTITADTPMGFHVDGEALAGGAHLFARVHPGALRVRA